MVTANIIARSHFTKAADGESSFYQFLKEIGVLEDGIPFSFKGKDDKHGRSTNFVAESWGGYFNADNVWTVFVSWRNRGLNETKVIHWTWDEASQCATNRRNWSFRG